MLRLLLSNVSAGLVYQLGTGRALDNARRDHIEHASAMAGVDALAARIVPPPAPTAAPAPARAAA
jgi:hypothetical protein